MGNSDRKTKTSVEVDEAVRRKLAERGLSVSEALEEGFARVCRINGVGGKL